ncbi:MAG: hypothetical protein NTY88_09020 [Bacteroidetes bacterium]|nr:hypothetical protein [Bacteroidota bacterium]
MQHLNDLNWSYNEFLAFVLVFGAEMNLPLSKEELEFIQERTQIENIGKIKTKVDSVSDTEGLDVIEHFRQKYLTDVDAAAKAKQDLEGLLKTPGKHSPFEKAAVHIIEKLI